MQNLFGEEYYRNYCGIDYSQEAHWNKFFGNIADAIIRDFSPKTVLDAGCAWGYLVAALRNRGVEAWGVDISPYAISKAHKAIRPYCAVGSLTEALPDTLPKSYDLVVSIEVFGHLHEHDGLIAIQRLCSYSDQIILSTSSDDTYEKKHYNVQQHCNIQQPEYWAREFARYGFFNQVDHSFDYISKDARCFCKSDDIARVIEEYERERRFLKEQGRFPHFRIQVCYDTGEGFSSDKNIEILSAGDTLDCEVRFPEPVGHIRINPDGGNGCLLKDLVIIGDYGRAEYKSVNGHSSENDELFLIDNPQIEISLPYKTEGLKISARILQNSEDMWLERLTYAQDEIEAAQAERDYYKCAYEAAHDEREQYRRALDETFTSRSWKITRPLRYLGSNVRKVQPVKSFFKSLARDGISVTLRKARDYGKGSAAPASRGANELSAEERAEQRSARFPENVLFSVLTPLYNTPEPLLRELLDSVIDQTYQNWELCLSDGSDGQHAHVQSVCMEYAAREPRIKYQKTENEGISGNTNRCLDMANGGYIALLDHDDLLAPSALYENALAIHVTGADVLYSDEDHLDESGRRVHPFFKPDWSPDLLYAQMYICHLLVIRRGMLNKAGRFNPVFDGSQDYDLMLRLCEATELIYHIPKVLYTWRETGASTAVNPSAKPYAQSAGLNALNAHLARKYGGGANAAESEHTFVYDVRFDTMRDRPLVSIIIPMKDKAELTQKCVESILNKSSYKNYEILLLNNRSEENETLLWLEKISRTDSRIRVIEADIDFNWSKLNNLGIQNAGGEVYILLNNDTLVITRDWIERLCENALRGDIGAVGPMLLHEDGTIQHAGVVVGMGGWADHIFKGMRPVHCGTPHVSPVINRNVMAVTGACMAVSKRFIEKIGPFDERLVICGSDVEICIRAYEAGLRNLYAANVQLYHLESQSRDSFIPKIDFQLCAVVYKEYLENIDPYFNPRLDIMNPVLTENVEDGMPIDPFKNYLRRHKLTYEAGLWVNNIKGKTAAAPGFAYKIPEVTPLGARKAKQSGELRLNILVPSLQKKDTFGGISTALSLFKTLAQELGCSTRVIILNTPYDAKSAAKMYGYRLVDMSVESSGNKQIVTVVDRQGKTLPVERNDVFVATIWWSAYILEPILAWQSKAYDIPLRQFLYLIQDFEPGFYPWSSRYMLADSTYKTASPKIAVFNSGYLRDYFVRSGYKFDHFFCFDPAFNETLARYLKKFGPSAKKKKQMIVYGRPSTPRNAFEMIVMALRLWSKEQPDIGEWSILSLGEVHPDIPLENGAVLRSKGKTSLYKYARIMLETYMGVSLMISPHPSYPPLEMSRFGVKTITNSYANKDMSSFSGNIVSLDVCNEASIAGELRRLADAYTEDAPLDMNAASSAGNDIKSICREIATLLRPQGHE